LPNLPAGLYRVQCDPQTQRCLAAPSYELDAEGMQTDQPLLRVPYCNAAQDEVLQRLAEGYQFVPAIAEAPPGWYRDERGRVMQFNFDLHRRIWLGGAWAPLWRRGEDELQGRARVDFGITADFVEGKKALRRLALLETELYLGQQSLDATLMRYDSSAEQDEPILRLTTFLGRPRRHDLTLDVGVWMEVARLEVLRREDEETSFLTLAATHLTLDLWHSRDLSSYVRVRAGPSLENDRAAHSFSLVPGAAFEGDLTLDADGFHHFTFAAEAEKIFLAEEVEGRPEEPERLRLRASYELILLAINDQPVSLVLGGRGDWRSDIPGFPATWEWSAHGGLRFSLWAPARRTAPVASPR
jgi:hypothetical protein